MGKLTVAEARKIDMVDYLSSLGFQAIKTRGEDYWYLSPFRQEQTPSFKINRRSNIWYDHGSGDGGNIIDFGILYHRVDVRGFLELLTRDYRQSDFSFHPQLKKESSISPVAGEKEKITDSKIIITATRQLSNVRLLHYLNERGIAPDLASQFCREVDFHLYKKQHTAIGFPNGMGGYELRNPYFKGSSSPKTFRFFDNGKKKLQVFEGFFDFLSWLSHFKDAWLTSNFLVLNSLSFFQRVKQTMEAHSSIRLWLDQGTAGQACTIQAINSHPAYEDKSSLYKDFDDLNDWHVHQLKQKQRLYNANKPSHSKTIKHK
ncbi:MAG: CHC2 zinc finger domain-containing protein [Chitinophagaceae bacterium]|nr:CHC2 zinc finger domain-containing protein [Chitinophagaceae bacterium]